MRKNIKCEIIIDMTSAERVLFYKSSGEALQDRKVKEGHSWSPVGVRGHADKLQRAYNLRGSIGVSGFVTVSGAGNIVRGDALRDQGIARGFEDFVGRLGTIQNTFVIAAALAERDVPHAILLAPGMRLGDQTAGRLKSHSHEAVMSAFEEEKVVLIAGGKGTDGNTTDGAIMHYAADFRREEPDVDVVVLKGTKVDGVYDGNPEQNQGARRFAHISAHTMLDDYARFQVVDRESLRIAAETGIDMIVYNDGAHDISEVMSAQAGIGTVVHGADHSSIMA